MSSDSSDSSEIARRKTKSGNIPEGERRKHGDLEQIDTKKVSFAGWTTVPIHFIPSLELCDWSGDPAIAITLMILISKFHIKSKPKIFVKGRISL
jgi:hypothetical protein